MSGPLTLVDRQYDTSRYENAFNEVSFSRPSVWGAAFHEAFLDNPEASYNRMNELDDAFGRPRKMQRAFAIGLGPIGLAVDMFVNRGGQEVQHIGQEEFNSSYAQLGLQWTPDMTQEAAAILAERKRRERLNQDIMSRGPGGVTETVGKFGSALVASLLSPTNIIASFIPVVGEAKWATWLAKFGPTRARALRGMAEGAVGNILVEPITYYARTQEQADFTAMDSLYNIVVGTVLSSGLHVAGGKIGDVLGKRTQAVAADMRTVDVAAKQMMDGQQVDVRSLDIANKADVAAARTEPRVDRVRAATTLDLDEMGRGYVPKHVVVGSKGKGRSKFEVMFPEEQGDLKNMRGRGRTEESAVQDLLSNYDVLRRFDLEPEGSQHVVDLQRQLDDLVDQRLVMRQRAKDPTVVRGLLQERGVPVNALEEQRLRITNRKKERVKISGKKQAKKLREFDAETARLEAEYADMKQTSIGDSYEQVLSNVRQDLQTIDGQIKQVRNKLHREAERQAIEQRQRQQDPENMIEELSTSSMEERLHTTDVDKVELDALDEELVIAQEKVEQFSDVGELSEAQKQTLSSLDQKIADAEAKGGFLDSIVNCVRGEG